MNEHDAIALNNDKEITEYLQESEELFFERRLQVHAEISRCIAEGVEFDINRLRG